MAAPGISPASDRRPSVHLLSGWHRHPRPPPFLGHLLFVEGPVWVPERVSKGVRSGEGQLILEDGNEALPGPKTV